MRKFYLFKLKELKELNKLKELFSSLIFYLSILIFIIGFGFLDAPTPFGWYQQFMPNLNGASIADITFTDSLNGFAVTGLRTAGDSSFILKTTDGGDNWTEKITNNHAFVRIEFINANTGFTNSFTKIFKTTNSGENWFSISLPGIFGDDMFVLSNDTIWLAMSESLTGGVFLTTNGGLNWLHQINWGSTNPSKIYMFNARIGFIGGGYTAKTTDGGSTWNLINGQDGFLSIHFTDSLTGWKCSATGMKKTTDGGINWITEQMPSGGIIQTSFIGDFSNINKDSIWGTGGYVLYPNGQIRGILYRTTNGGNRWFFQIPDTSIHINGSESFINFINPFYGWGYRTQTTGIHTISGGDTIFFTGLKQISKDIPKEFILFQNYPNPFNPNTNIKYQISKNKEQISNIKISVFDITGKHMIDLVNEKQTPGEYIVTFDGTGYSSGVYFYSLYVNGVLVETKRMILLK